MIFLSAYSEKCKAATSSGFPEYVEKIVKFSPDGNMYLEDGSTRNRQAEINSYKASCDVNLMIKRYENGDQLALLRDNTGAYCDLSSLPKNIHDATKLRKQIGDLYSSMGDDVKVKYRNLNEFLCAFSTKGNFDEFCGFVGDIVKQRMSKSNSGGDSDA